MCNQAEEASILIHNKNLKKDFPTFILLLIYFLNDKKMHQEDATPKVKIIGGDIFRGLVTEQGTYGVDA